jgi:hypothetical protein
MKTTVEIADDLFQQAQAVAREQKTTFRALTERGLRLVLKERGASGKGWKWKPMTVEGHGLSDTFEEGGWERIRDEIYRGRGA